MIALILAAYLHRPPALVQLVYEAGGTDAVAVVSCENPQWITWAVKREARGHTSYGLFMVDDEWWPQFRFDLGKHIEQGVAIMNHFYAGLNPEYDFAIMVSRYNGGWKSGAYSQAWGRHVARVRDDLAHWLWMALR